MFWIFGAGVEVGDHGRGDSEGVGEGLLGDEEGVGIGLLSEVAMGLYEGFEGLIDVGLAGPVGKGDDVALGGMDGGGCIEEETEIEAVVFEEFDELAILGGEGLRIGDCGSL